jgi:uncharacterized repeat protein (TIGR04076 family)
VREKVYPRPLRRGKYRLVFTVDRIEGRCPVHEVGDRIVVEDPELILEETDRVCTYALAALLSSTSSLAREVTPPDWVSSPVNYFCCPDAGGFDPSYKGNGTVIFKMVKEKVEPRTPEDFVSPEKKKSR